LKAEWKPFAAKNRDWFALSAADFQAKHGSVGKS
jgi:hypothetical protein